MIISDVPKNFQFCLRCDCNITLHSASFVDANTIKISFCRNCTSCDEFKGSVS